MELRHLRYFLAAAEVEHFGRAAARLGIVQPALTKQVRELEEELGARLFEKCGRSVRLTTAGRHFSSEASALLTRLARAAASTREVAAGTTGRLSIGYVDTSLYAPVLPGLFAAQRRARPGIRLELHEATSLKQADMLASGAIDVGFVYHLPSGLPKLKHQRVFSDRIALILPSRHRLATKRLDSLAQIRDEDFVWIPRTVSPAFHDGVFAACAKCGFEPRIVQHGATDNSLLSLVAAGAGLSFSLASGRFRRPAGVTFKLIKELSQAVELCAVWRSDNPNPSLKDFVDRLASGIKKPGRLSDAPA